MPRPKSSSPTMMPRVALGIAQAGEMAKIAIGRDAADVSFITSYGELELTEKLISVKAV